MDTASGMTPSPSNSFTFRHPYPAEVQAGAGLNGNHHTEQPGSESDRSPPVLTEVHGPNPQTAAEGSIASAEIDHVVTTFDSENYRLFQEILKLAARIEKLERKNEVLGRSLGLYSSVFFILEFMIYLYFCILRLAQLVADQGFLDNATPSLQQVIRRICASVFLEHGRRDTQAVPDEVPVGSQQVEELEFMAVAQQPPETATMSPTHTQAPRESQEGSQANHNSFFSRWGRSLSARLHMLCF